MHSGQHPVLGFRGHRPVPFPRPTLSLPLPFSQIAVFFIQGPALPQSLVVRSRSQRVPMLGELSFVFLTHFLLHLAACPVTSASARSTLPPPYSLHALPLPLAHVRWFRVVSMTPRPLLCPSLSIPKGRQIHHLLHILGYSIFSETDEVQQIYSLQQ